MKSFFTRLLDIIFPVRPEDAAERTSRTVEATTSRYVSKVWKQVTYSTVHRVATQAESTAVLQTPGAIAVIVGETGPKRVQFKCPCGCGDEVRVNVSPRNPRPVWRFHVDNQGKLSLSPSVWRASGCRAHFILTRNVANLLLDEPDPGYTA